MPAEGRQAIRRHADIRRQRQRRRLGIRECFDLTDTGYARVVAGVPPDYFRLPASAGNPHYN